MSDQEIPIEYLETRYDVYHNKFVVRWPETGEWIAMNDAQDRLVWKHFCSMGGYYKFTRNVKECDQCEEKNPKADL